MQVHRKISATVLTGFLGAGKTTLLNRLLQAEDSAGTAVIVNEFGEVGIDGQLIVETEEGVIELNNGCICCTVRGDLTEAIHGLISSGRPLRRIIIETSGLADPAPVVQSFLLDDVLKTHVALDAVVTVVDARHFLLERECEVAREQIAFADILVLNKADLVTTDELAAIEREVRHLNALARLHRTVDGAVRPADVLEVGAFDLQNLLHISPDLLDEHDHEHDTAISSVAFTTTAPLDADAVSRWLARLAQDFGQDLLRSKGVLHLADEARRYVFHGVHMTFDGRPGRRWDAAEARVSQVVFIGRNLDRDALEAGLLACTATALQPVS